MEQVAGREVRGSGSAAAGVAGGSEARELDRIVDLVHTGHGDPATEAERLVAGHPTFVEAHCLRIAIWAMRGRDGALGQLARCVDAAQTLRESMDERQHRHLQAATDWLAHGAQRGLRRYGEIARDFPKDTIALRVAHTGDLHWSRQEQLRDRVAAVLAHWRVDEPGYAHVLAMHAFGLAEMGEYARAERAGIDALARDPRNAGAVHAVAHALEMQGRATEGIDWIESTREAWTDSRGYAQHLWWHRALYHLELDDVEAALAILDDRLADWARPDGPALADASALLWRLDLRGVDVRARWRPVADAWSGLALGGVRPFIDAHAMLAFVGAGRLRSADRLVGELRRSAKSVPDLGVAIDEAALPACLAIRDFGRGDYRSAAGRLVAYRHLTQRCGGSRAQCDLVLLTLLEAAIRSGQRGVAAAALAERRQWRPDSASNRWLARRVARLAAD